MDERVPQGEKEPPALDKTLSGGKRLKAGGLSGKES